MSNDFKQTKQLNLPSYVNIPFFLYQDARLEKSATLMAAFFYSLHTAGKSIKASRDYLCKFSSIAKTQYYFVLNQLESCGYITRTGNTSRRKITWIYNPVSSILVDESEKINNVTNLNTSSVYRTQLVRSTGQTSSVDRIQILELDIKEDIKDIPDFANRGKKKVVSDYKKDERFMSFYSAYPKKQDPRDAWKAFKSIVGDNDVLLQQIVEDIKLRKTTHTNWQDPQYIKYPAAYLLKGEYLSEIYNAEQEQADKKAKDAEQARKRTAKQEAASQKRAENERINNARKISDASAYQAVVRHAPSKATENALSGLRALLN
jgi:hypothetical protein